MCTGCTGEKTREFMQTNPRPTKNNINPNTVKLSKGPCGINKWTAVVHVCLGGGGERGGGWAFDVMILYLLLWLTRREGWTKQETRVFVKHNLLWSRWRPRLLRQQLGGSWWLHIPPSLSLFLPLFLVSSFLSSILCPVQSRVVHFLFLFVLVCPQLWSWIDNGKDNVSAISLRSVTDGHRLAVPLWRVPSLVPSAGFWPFVRDVPLGMLLTVSFSKIKTKKQKSITMLICLCCLLRRQALDKDTCVRLVTKPHFGSFFDCCWTPVPM